MQPIRSCPRSLYNDWRSKTPTTMPNRSSRLSTSLLMTWRTCTTLGRGAFFRCVAQRLSQPRAASAAQLFPAALPLRAGRCRVPILQQPVVAQQPTCLRFETQTKLLLAAKKGVSGFLLLARFSF